MTKHNLIVLSAAILISAGILIMYGKKKQPQFDYQLFHTEKGWGYNILVNDSVFIHQEDVPVIAAAKGFDHEQQAKKTAMLIIKKLEQHQLPTLLSSDIDSAYRESRYIK